MKTKHKIFDMIIFFLISIFTKKKSIKIKKILDINKFILS
mgnify:CR=1 FL=1